MDCSLTTPALARLDTNHMIDPSQWVTLLWSHQCRPKNYLCLESGCTFLNIKAVDELWKIGRIAMACNESSTNNKLWLELPTSTNAYPRSCWVSPSGPLCSSCLPWALSHPLPFSLFLTLFLFAVLIHPFFSLMPFILSPIPSFSSFSVFVLWLGLRSGVHNFQNVRIFCSVACPWTRNSQTLQCWRTVWPVSH